MLDYYQFAHRQGKTCLNEMLLSFKIMERGIINVPEKPFMIWIGKEEIIWLPTGEVISRRLE